MGRSDKRAEKQVNGKEERGRQRREERKGDKEAAKERVDLVLILGLEKLRQWDHEFEDSLGYKESSRPVQRT